MADISKIKLPSGNEYQLKDQGARDLIAAINNWDYIVCSSASDTPKDVEWDDDGTTITGTLVASADTMYTIYLVPSINGDNDIYDEYITVNPSSGVYKWELFGNTKLPDMSQYVSKDEAGEFAYADTGYVTIQPKGTNADSAVTFTGGTTDKVLGEDTTFTNSSSAVSFGNHTTADVLTSNVTATVPKTSGTKKYLTATASGGTVDVSDSGSAITSLGEATTDTFVKSYPGATSKLATTSVTGVGSTTTLASKATAGTAVAVAKVGTSTTVASGSLGAETATRGADTPMWGATVDNEVLSFTFKPIDTTSVTPAESNGTITPYTFADVDVPIKDASATTVATGSLSNSGSGDTVMTGLGTPTTADAVTEYGDPTTDTFAQAVSMTAQPTVALTADTATSSGAVEFVSGLSTSGTDAVTFDTATSGNTASAITALGAATAAAQTITVGTNDKVDAVTDIGSGTAAAQTFTGTQESYTVNPN